VIDVDVDRELTATPLPFALGRARKVGTDPPRYVFEVNGRDVRLSLRDVLSPRRFARAVLAQIGQVIPCLTRDQLDLMLIRACRRLERVPAGARESVRRWKDRRSP
jgi:hypothetical protein